MEQKTRRGSVDRIRSVVRNLPPPRPVGEHKRPQDSHNPVDHIELCMSIGLAFCVDDRPGASTREECMALVSALCAGSATHLDALRALPSTAIIVLAALKPARP